MLRHCDFVHVDLKKQKRTKVYISSHSTVVLVLEDTKQKHSRKFKLLRIGI